MKYSEAADKVVAEEPAGWGNNLASWTTKADDPPVLSQFLILRPAHGIIDNVLSEYDNPLLFLHARTAPNGTEWLVIVRRPHPGSRQSFDAPIGFEVFLDPPSWTIRDSPLSPPTLTGDVINPLFHRPDGTPTPTLIFYAGQFDPADASHFTIAYKRDGDPGVIDGYLRDPQKGGTQPWVELIKR